MTLTAHASARSQQRGIPPLVVDLLLRFGRCEHDQRGGEIFYFDHRSKKQIARYSGGLFADVTKHLNTYAVVADGRIVTVGLRRKKINRK